MSAFKPSYFKPAIISGGAQHGEPQAVFNYSLLLYVFDNPKSTIFMLFS